MSELRRRLDRHRVECQRATARSKEEKAAYKEAVARTQSILKAQEFLQGLAQEVQQQAHAQIARVVSRCLTAVFDGQYTLEIEFVKTRGRTEARLHFVKEGQLIYPGVDSGGVREVAALALRLASILLSTPPSTPFVDLDEPFSGVDAENVPKIAELLKTLSVELGIQFCVRTHSPALEIGKVVQL